MKFNITNVKKYLPTTIFCSFIGFMMLMFFVLPKYDYSPNEKRFLQDMPTATVKSVFSGDFGQEFEKYLSDHFQWRTFFVGFNAYYDLFSGRNGANGVYKCKDHYIINKPITYNSDSLDKNIKRFNKFSKFVEKDLTFVIVPSTGYIMHDVLPKVHLSYNDNDILDSIKHNISEGSVFIDLFDEFQKSKDSTQIYYKTDHHWTTNGSYIAYTQLCKKFNISPINKNTFDIEKHDGFFGTTYSRGAWWFTSKPDILEVWKNKNGYDISVTIDDGAQGKKQSKSMFFEQHLNNMDKYPVFLDGNHGLVKITNNRVNSGSLLVLKDSFAHSIAPFLTEHYRDIYLVDLRYYKSPVSELVKNNNIDNVIVIYGIDNIVNDSNISWLK